MSTKIYWAVKFKQNRLNEFIDLVKDLIFKEEIKDWKTRFNRIPDSMVEEKIQLQKHDKIVKLSHSLRSKIARYCIIRDDINQMIKDSYINSSIKDDLKEVGLNIWLYKGNYYCIPFGHLSNIFHKMKLPDWVKEYSYWNNVDQPDNISDKAWRKRGEVWDEVCLKNVEDWDKRRLSHEIFSWKNFMTFFHYGLIIEKKLKLYPYLTGL